MKNVSVCFVLWYVRCLVSAFVFPHHFLSPHFSTWIIYIICLKGKEIQAREGFQMPFCVPTTLSALNRKEYIQEMFCLGYLSTVRCGHGMVNPDHLAKAVSGISNIYFSVLAEARFHGISSEAGGLSETHQGSTWLQSNLKDKCSQCSSEVSQNFLAS